MVGQIECIYCGEVTVSKNEIRHLDSEYVTRGTRVYCKNDDCRSTHYVEDKVYKT